MPGYLEKLFAAGDFVPRGMSYLWRPGILALHAGADALLGLACFSILFTLLHFVRHRADLQFSWIFVSCAVFLAACGAAHFMEVVTLWAPLYWISAIVKVIAALAAVPTAVVLARMIPKALRWPSPAALQRATRTLELEIAKRKYAEAEARRIHDAVESRVAERTRELEATYQTLRETQEANMQHERLRSLGRMASGIAHDINNTLTPAMLYTQSLLDHENLSARARGDLIIVQQAIDAVRQTVGRINDVYRGPDVSATCASIGVAHRSEQQRANGHNGDRGV